MSIFCNKKPMFENCQHVFEYNSSAKQTSDSLFLDFKGIRSEEKLTLYFDTEREFCMNSCHNYYYYSYLQNINI